MVSLDTWVTVVGGFMGAVTGAIAGHVAAVRHESKRNRAETERRRARLDHLARVLHGSALENLKTARAILKDLKRHVLSAERLDTGPWISLGPEFLSLCDDPVYMMEVVRFFEAVVALEEIVDSKREAFGEKVLDGRVPLDRLPLDLHLLLDTAESRAKRVVKLAKPLLQRRP